MPIAVIKEVHKAGYAQNKPNNPRNESEDHNNQTSLVGLRPPFFEAGKLGKLIGSQYRLGLVAAELVSAIAQTQIFWKKRRTFRASLHGLYGVSPVSTSGETGARH